MGGALVGVAFGAVEGAVVDMAVTQPLRVHAFHDGGWSGSEVATSAVSGGAFGGVLRGVGAALSGRAATTPPPPTTAADDLARDRRAHQRRPRPGEPGRPRAALPASGCTRPRRRRSPPSSSPPPGCSRPRATASTPAPTPPRSSAPPPATAAGSPSCSAPTEPTAPAVENALLDANGRLARQGSGDIVVDARGTGLDVDTAGQGLVAAITKIMTQGHEPPDSVRFVFDDRSIYFP